MAAMAAPAAAAPAAADVAASAPKLLRGAEATGFITGLLCRKGLSPARALVRPMAFFSAYPAAAYPLRERCARFGLCVGLSLLDATTTVTAIDRHVDPQVFDLGTRPWDLQLVDWYLEADMTPARQDCPRSVRVVLGVPAAVTQCVFCACKLLPPEDVPALAWTSWPRPRRVRRASTRASTRCGARWSRGFAPTRSATPSTTSTTPR